MNFNERCYALLRKVPSGKVTTYKSLAKQMNTKAYRAVGNAMNKNPHAPEVPCYRVIGTNGSLVGFASGLKNKEAILKQEGIEIINGKVDLKKYEFNFN